MLLLEIFICDAWLTFVTIMSPLEVTIIMCCPVVIHTFIPLLTTSMIAIIFGGCRIVFLVWWHVFPTPSLSMSMIIIIFGGCRIVLLVWWHVFPTPLWNMSTFFVCIVFVINDWCHCYWKGIFHVTVMWKKCEWKRL